MGTQEVGRGRMRFGQDGVTLLARSEGAFVVRVGALQVRGHGVNHPTWDLRAARPIEVAIRLVAVTAGKCGELGPDPLEIGADPQWSAVGGTIGTGWARSQSEISGHKSLLGGSGETTAMLRRLREVTRAGRRSGQMRLD